MKIKISRYSFYLGIESTEIFDMGWGNIGPQWQHADTVSTFYMIQGCLVISKYHKKEN